MGYDSWCFIIIDDDALSNHILGVYLGKLFPGADIKSFTNSDAGFTHIRTMLLMTLQCAPIVFLDINMPRLSGWDILNRIATEGGMVKDRLKVYMYTASIHTEDKVRAQNNVLVSGFLEKPITLPKIKAILGL